MIFAYDQGVADGSCATELADQVGHQIENHSIDFHGEEMLFESACPVPSNTQENSSNAPVAAGVCVTEVATVLETMAAEDPAAADLLDVYDNSAMAEQNAQAQQSHPDAGRFYGGDLIEFHTQEEGVLDHTSGQSATILHDEDQEEEEGQVREQDYLEQEEEVADGIDVDDHFFPESQMLGRPYEETGHQEENNDDHGTSGILQYYNDEDRSYMGSASSHNLISNNDSGTPALPAINEIQMAISESFEQVRLAYEAMQRKVSDTASAALVNSSRANSFSLEQQEQEAANTILQHSLEISNLRETIRGLELQCLTLQSQLNESVASASTSQMASQEQIVQFKDALAKLKEFVNDVRQATYNDLSCVCQEAFDLVATFKADADLQLENSEVGIIN